MVKRTCPNCKRTKFSAAEEKTWTCDCGKELGPELNMQIGENEKKPAAFPVVGDVLSGYKVLAIWKKEYVFAVNQKAVEPYVVWHLDQDGKPYSGIYRKDSYSAEREFAALCFKWFDNSDELGNAISILHQLQWSRNINTMEYDSVNDEILLCEEALMQLIMKANPMQEPVRIRLMSRSELKEWRQSNRLIRSDAKVIIPTSQPKKKPSGVIVDMRQMNLNAIHHQDRS